MESAPGANLLRNSGEIPKSYFQSIVFLDDWWLVKAENDLQGTRIAIAGYTIGENKCRRFCSSLPIHKRYEENNLETTDGKCVILRGFLNEALSVENGFPPNICNHFGFGFPPYWKDLTEKFMVKESPSMNVVEVNLEKLSTTGDQANISSDDNNLGSQGMKENKTKKKSKQTKFPAVPLLQNFDSVISGSEKNSSLPCIAPGSKDFFCAGSVVEDCTTEDTPVNCLKNTISSSLEGKVDSFAFTYKDVEDSQIHESGRSLSACHLSAQSRSRPADDGLRKAELDKDKNSYEDILIRTKVGPETRSASRLNTKQNDQTSATIPASGIYGSEDSSSELDPISVKDKFDQLPETLDQVKDLKKVKSKGNVQKKANNKATKSLSTPASADNDGLQKTKLDNDKNLSEDILIRSTNRPNKRSMSRFTKRNNPTSATMPATGLCGSEGNSSELDPISVKDKFEQLPETLNQVKDRKKVKTKGNMQKKANNKATKSPSTPASADNEKQIVVSDNEKQTANAEKSSLSGNAKSPCMNRRRKLSFETPERGNEKVSVDLPQYSSFKRSRSGRVQMRPMEFWRNQRPVYSADRTLTAIEDPGAGQSSTCMIGSMSTPRKKGRKLF